MTKLGSVTIIILFLLLNSCANLTYVNQYSKESIEALNKWEKVDSNLENLKRNSCDRAFFQSNNTKERLNQSRTNEMVISQSFVVDCEYESYRIADSLINGLHTVTKAFYEQLMQLSDKDLVKVDLSDLEGAVKKNEIVEVSEKEVEAYGKAIGFLTRAVTQGLVKKKIKESILEGMPLMDTLLLTFQNVLIEKSKILEDNRNEVYAYYKWRMANSSSFGERLIIDREYLIEKRSITIKIEQIDDFIKVLETLREGLLPVKNNYNKVTKLEFAEALSAYYKELKDVKKKFDEIESNDND